uniref:Protein kinase domain-containing protein n=1 Tax=Quercus lobata TaxID=97700 RepID=A0A7N2LHC8_QUELO
MQVRNALNLWTSKVHKSKRAAGVLDIITVGRCIYKNAPNISRKLTQTHQFSHTHPSHLSALHSACPHPHASQPRLYFCALLRGRDLLPKHQATLICYQKPPVATSTPPYIAVDNITLDCGSFGNSKATDERDWIGDIGSKYGPIEQNNESNSSEAQRQASVESITTVQLGCLIPNSHMCFRSHLARNSFGCTFTQLHTQAPLFYINYSMALEMVYRLNIGGSSIPPMEDTGMFRQWSEDRTDYLLSDGVNPRDPSLKLKCSKIPKYIAPDAVYQSAATMEPWIHVSGTREFTIYIDYQLAQETGDVILWADDNDTSYYKDYVVMIQNKGEDSHTLAIDLHPRTDAALRDTILNGVEVFKLSDLSGNLAGLNMVPPPMDQQPSLAANKSKTKNTMFIAIGSGVGFLVVATLVCFLVLCKLKKTGRYGSYHPLAKWWCWFRPDSYKREFSRTASSLPGELCRYFRLDEIKTATNNFNEDLIVGAGGFGNVYKGLIEQGNIVVAIKRMKQESQQGAREFMTEIEMLSKLRHVHLVSLIGYCNDEGEMILVYEYMTNDYAGNQQLTEKSDVYSFGVVMFEVLCVRKALNQRLQQEEQNLASWARKCIERGTICEIIDPYLMNKIAPKCFKVYVELTESCVSDHGNERPTMNDVMEKLEFALELQEYAEATKDTDSKVVSFDVATANGAPWYNNVYHGQMLESSSGTELSTISTGLSYPGLDSIGISITRQDDSSATKNSSSSTL